MTPQNWVGPIYSKYRDRMVGYAVKRVPDPDEAEDLVHEAFLALAVAKQTKHPEAYLHGTLRNLIATSLRKRYRRLAHEDDQPLNEDVAGESDPEAEYETMETGGLVRNSLGSLKPRYRRILSLWASGHGPSEIARLHSANGVETTPSQISSALPRAFRKLAIEFKRRGVLPAGVPLSLKQILPLQPSRSWLVKRAAVALSLAFATAAIVGIVPSSVPGSDSDEVRLSVPRSLSGSSEQGSTVALVSGEWGAEAIGERTSRPDFEVGVNVAGHDHRVSRRRESGDEPPGLVEQISGIVRDPTSVPLPECGGLPGCSGER